ncbi:MAG: NADP-dependent malic enzyme [Candidatus Kapaibacteriales bacterium]
MTKKDALDYHQYPEPGKLEVIPSKPFVTQRDLSLAYSPGVAEPCRDIHADEQKVYDYTAKGNLVAVVSNGTAVLGLGDIGPSASKPVMEGKGGLFKVFADINVFDIELDAKTPEEVIKACEMLAPTFGGINLEDIKAPDSFIIEETLKERLDIPVFHDDQHGTAIISGAALLNAMELTGKKIEEVTVVYNGAGAAAIASAKFHMALGVRPENVFMCDSKGVIYKGRTESMNEYKAEFAIETDKRSLADALRDADVFCGLSVANVVSKEMVKSMAKDPVVMAMANPDPEITYEDAIDAREDVIMATGRSDYPNQVNNVLGFRFIFRGALDVHSKQINMEMKIAAAQALADLAKEEVPESVKRAYGAESMEFGRQYIIPKPFDPRVLTRVAPAVAKAAMDTGVARRQIPDFDEYISSLNIRMGRSQNYMRLIHKKAKTDKKRIVFPEGQNQKIIRAAQEVKEEGIGDPILLGKEEVIRQIAEEYGYSLAGIDIILPEDYHHTNDYINEYHSSRSRKGVTLYDARKQILTNKNSFGAMMVQRGDADIYISGLTTNYTDAIRPALKVVGKNPKYSTVAGVYIISTKQETYFFADTTVNINPTAEEVADIAIQVAKFTKFFDIKPKVALLSYSNFGSASGDSPTKMRKALEIIKEREPNLIVDGEMQADTAVVPSIIDSNYQFSDLKGGANVLVFPNLDASNIAYKLLSRIGSTSVTGPILLGANKPVHILQFGAEVSEIVDVAAMAVVDAQQRQSEK